MKTKKQILNSGTKDDLANRIVFLNSRIEELEKRESEEIKVLKKQHEKLKTNISSKMRWIEQIATISDPVVLMEIRNMYALLEGREQEMYQPLNH